MNRCLTCSQLGTTVRPAHWEEVNNDANNCEVAATYIKSCISQFLVLCADLCDSPSIIVREQEISAKRHRNTGHSDGDPEQSEATHLGGVGETNCVIRVTAGS